MTTPSVQVRWLHQVYRLTKLIVQVDMSGVSIEQGGKREYPLLNMIQSEIHKVIISIYSYANAHLFHIFLNSSFVPALSHFLNSFVFPVAGCQLALSVSFWTPISPRSTLGGNKPFYLLLNFLLLFYEGKKPYYLLLNFLLLLYKVFYIKHSTYS